MNHLLLQAAQGQPDPPLDSSAPPPDLAVYLAYAVEQQERRERYLDPLPTSKTDETYGEEDTEDEKMEDAQNLPPASPMEAAIQKEEATPVEMERYRRIFEVSATLRVSLSL